MTNFRQRIDLRIALIAAFALLFAQLGAMTHAYSHVPQFDAASYAPDQPAGHQVCGECLNFAPLLSAAGAPAVPVFDVPPQRELAALVARDSLHEKRTRLAFRSRAPPVAR